VIDHIGPLVRCDAVDRGATHADRPRDVAMGMAGGKQSPDLFNEA
jgi:hypothetical protein